MTFRPARPVFPADSWGRDVRTKLQLCPPSPVPSRMARSDSQAEAWPSKIGNQAPAGVDRKASSAAAMVASMSAWVWLRETNIASNWEGGR